MCIMGAGRGKGEWLDESIRNSVMVPKGEGKRDGKRNVSTHTHTHTLTH